MEEGISRRRFIRLGGALGVGAASASVLAACGGSESGSGSGSGSGGGSGGGSGNGSGGQDASGKNTGGQDAGGQNAGGQNAGGGGSDKSGGSKEKKAGGGQAIAQATDVAPGSAVDFKDSGGPAVLVHLDSGDFVAYSAVCTHQGCDVAYQGGQLVCPCHGSVFDPASGGAVVTGPAQTPLPEIPVEVRGGDVLKA